MAISHASCVFLQQSWEQGQIWETIIITEGDWRNLAKSRLLKGQLGPWKIIYNEVVGNGARTRLWNKVSEEHWSQFCTCLPLAILHVDQGPRKMVLWASPKVITLHYNATAASLKGVTWWNKKEGASSLTSQRNTSWHRGTHWGNDTTVVTLI